MKIGTQTEPFSQLDSYNPFQNGITTFDMVFSSLLQDPNVLQVPDTLYGGCGWQCVLICIAR